MAFYTFLRHLADSWVLLAMFAFFVGAILFVWRPGSGRAQSDAASLPFRNENVPLSRDPEARK